MSLLASGFPAPPLDGIDLLGPLRLTFYALCILAGIIAAAFVTTKLWKSRGGTTDNVLDAMLWAVLLGIVGGRLYHVVTSPDAYFGENGELSRIPQIWNGGLGIIGAIALGAVGVWIACRRYGMKFPAFADAVVPGVLLAQAFGRWGNWFNQELYGAPTSLPWGLNVDAQYRVPEVQHMSQSTLFHPTFLYESVWNLLGFVLLLALYKRFQIKQGLLLWTYVAYYSIGRFWIESLRIDELDKSTQWINILGLEWRLNMWVSLALFIIAIVMLVWLWSRRPRTEAQFVEELRIYRPGSPARAEMAASAAGERTAEADEEPADSDEETADSEDVSHASSKGDSARDDAEHEVAQGSDPGPQDPRS